MFSIDDLDDGTECTFSKFMDEPQVPLQDEVQPAGKGYCRESLRGAGGHKLNITQQCIRKDVARGWREVILPLYLLLVKLIWGAMSSFGLSYSEGHIIK